MRLLVAVCVFLGASVWAFGKEFRVTDYGVVPNDGMDDGPALRKLAKELKTNPGATLVFAPGRYDFKGGPFGSPSVMFEGCEGLRIEGEGAELVGQENVSLFVFVKCRDLIVRGFFVDWDPLPFSGGKVESVGAGYFDLAPQFPHTAQSGRPVQTVGEYDPERRRLARRGLDHYQSDFKKPTELVGENLVRCFVNGNGPKAGSFQIVRHLVYRSNAFTISQCQQTQFEGITVYAAPGMGFYGERSTDVSLRKVQVRIRPESKRWMSTTADGSHFNNCRGSVSYEECYFEGMGDDAINVHSMMMVVAERADSRTVTLEAGRKDASVPVPVAGDKLEFLSPKTLELVFTGTVKNVEASQRKVVVGLEEDLPQEVIAGAVVGNANTCPKLWVNRCQVERNRARGFLIQTREVLIENCRFSDVSGAALHLTTDANYWWEGQGVRNCTIRNNEFERCNFGAGRGVGVIDIFAEVGKAPAPAGVHRGVKIEGNRFSEPDGAAIHVSSAEDVQILNNEMQKTERRSVVLDHCRDVVLSGNRLSTENRLSEGNELVEYGPAVDRGSVRINDPK